MTSKTATKIFTVLALAGGGTAMADTAAPRTLRNGRPACGNVVRSRGKGGGGMRACEPVNTATAAQQLRAAVAKVIAAKPVVIATAESR